MNWFGVRTIRESIELSWTSEVTCSAAASIQDIERRSESKSDDYLGVVTPVFRTFRVVTLSSRNDFPAVIREKK